MVRACRRLRGHPIHVILALAGVAETLIFRLRSPVSTKYDPLRRLLVGSRPQTITMTFVELDDIIGGLPPSARSYRAWWGNSTVTAGSQADAWMGAGYRVQTVELGVAVTFAVAVGDDTAGRHAATGQRVRTVLDGVDQLEKVLKRAGYPSVVAAVAEHAVFLHPSTVAQAHGVALFPTIRDMLRRGQFEVLEGGRRVLLDDNRSPTDAFLWAAGLRRGLDVQFNHVWTESRNPDTYTALWNLFATPAFLAKTTDTSNHPEVTAALKFRAFDLFGQRPAGEPEPVEPAGYRDLEWAPSPDPVSDLQMVITGRLRASPKSRTTVACREIGWLFSDWQPDPTLSARASGFVASGVTAGYDSTWRSSSATRGSSGSSTAATVPRPSDNSGGASVTESRRSGHGDGSSEVEAFLSRTVRTDVHPLATIPAGLKAPSQVQAWRGVVIAYHVKQFAVYRAVIDRLAPGERFAVETIQGSFEMTADDFYNEFAHAAATPSYLTGTPSHPHACYYVWSGQPPEMATPFLVRD